MKWLIVVIIRSVVFIVVGICFICEFLFVLFVVLVGYVGEEVVVVVDCLYLFYLFCWSFFYVERLVWEREWMWKERLKYCNFLDMVVMSVFFLVLFKIISRIVGLIFMILRRSLICCILLLLFLRFFGLILFFLCLEFLFLGRELKGFCKG